MSAAPFPEHLEYLRPALVHLLSRDSETVDESVDTTALCIALKNRIGNSPKLAATAILSRDKADLDKWLTSVPSHPGHFISAFMSEPSELVSYLSGFEPPKGWKPPRHRKPQRRRQIQMQVPPGFRWRREGSGLFMQKGEEIGSRHCVGVGFDKGPSLRALKGFANADPAVKLEPVNFGNLSGTRVVRDGVTVTLLLKGVGVKYCLYIEGDSGLVEPYLHTLAVEECEI